MATFTLTLSAADQTRVSNAYATKYSYQANIPDPVNPGATIPNPETKAAFVQRMIAYEIKSTVKEVEQRAARLAAEAGVTDPVIT